MASTPDFIQMTHTAACLCSLALHLPVMQPTVPDDFSDAEDVMRPLPRESQGESGWLSGFGASLLQAKWFSGEWSEPEHSQVSRLA
jgi:hypothetical protein